MPWTTEQKIFIVKAYFRQKSIHAAQLQFKNGSDVVNFVSTQWSRHIFCCQVTWPLRTISSGIAHPMSTVFKSHYTLWSALPGLPSPNMASLDHSGSRTTTSGLWQSTPSDMSRCLASSGQHLVDGESERGCQVPSVVPAGWCHSPLLKRIIGMATAVFPRPTDQLQVWPAVVAAFTGFEHPRFLSVGIP